MHCCLSGSVAHECSTVRNGHNKMESRKGGEAMNGRGKVPVPVGFGRIQVALVKRSTPSRIKYRGQVPPRLDTVLSRVR